VATVLSCQPVTLVSTKARGRQMETRGGQASIDPDQALPLPVRIVTRLLVTLAILDWLRALAERT